jgi:hypothetical protein
MPIAFANWPTADPLHHPYEPLETEDLVGVDANHVRATAAWPGGTFASYHAYPYYPDFQRYEYADAPDPYAAYLAALRDHHAQAGIPVLVTEFGVPSSIGTAHEGPLGRGQGDHSEARAMQIDANMLRVIHEQGLSAGFVFSWTDEWFKRTWNTMNRQVPADRRQLWHDPLTNEQYFGVVATDPTGAPGVGPAVRLEDPAGRPAVRMTSLVDESFLHLAITLAEPVPDHLTIGLDTLPDLTGAPPPGSGDQRPDTAFVLDLKERTGQAWIRSTLDPLPLDYPIPASARPAPQNGWVWSQLVTNRELTVPVLNRHQAIELFNAGLLRYGTLDPAAPGADSRALWVIDGPRLDIRIPWALAGFSDPSSRRVLVPKDGEATAVVTPGVTVVLSAEGTDQPTGQVTWEQWQAVHYKERIKPNADLVRSAMIDTARE